MHEYTQIQSVYLSHLHRKIPLEVDFDKEFNIN